MAVFNRRDGNAPIGAVYVGRPTLWGNPFVIGPDGSRAAVIKKYEIWLTARPDLIARARKELKGKDLVCWCAPEACHAHVLERVANGGMP